jgi:hypothetical protein
MPKPPQYDLAINYVGAHFSIVPLSTAGQKFVRLTSG